MRLAWRRGFLLRSWSMLDVQGVCIAGERGEDFLKGVIGALISPYHQSQIIKAGNYFHACICTN